VRRGRETDVSDRNSVLTRGTGQAGYSTEEWKGDESPQPFGVRPSSSKHDGINVLLPGLLCTRLPEYGSDGGSSGITCAPGPPA
jgi:hypothetical protein